jgi:hypothetical protein
MGPCVEPGEARAESAVAIHFTPAGMIRRDFRFRDSIAIAGRAD